MKKSPMIAGRERRIENKALKAEILSEIKADKTKSKKENVSHDLQILILHYLGIGEEINNIITGNRNDTT